MKAILVMEIPESCVECPMEMDVEDTSGKLWKGSICRGCGKRNEDRSRKPDWCPLKPMPERKEEKYNLLQKDDSGNWKKCGEQTDSFGAGWNACIDAIEGRGRDE